MIKKSKNIGFILSLFLLSTLLFSGCKKKNKHILDLKEEKVEVKLNRLEKKLFSVETEQDYVALDQLDSNFISLYKNEIMRHVTGGIRYSVPEQADAYIRFLHFKDIEHLFNAVDSTFENLDFLQKELNSAFSYYHHYFPSLVIPTFNTAITQLYSQNILLDSAIYVSLDYYLGDDFAPYKSPSLELPEYKIRTFRKDYITRNAVFAWIDAQFQKSKNSQSRLLDEMIYEGKLLYAMDRLMPEMPDSLKIGYEKGKIEWCFENEFQIWSFLINENLLYSTELARFRGIITDAPFSTGPNVPQESPARIATWSGWQIVRKYMDKNPKITLLDLMNETDSDKILRLSGYKP
ncbi:MAG: hypothetical protein H6607_02405 [Flavobacteriales bacterium]|nr:hypothetical protein [Flavobacteriales bacterium]